MSANPTSTAGTLTQFGTDAQTADLHLLIRCYTVPVTSGGAKTVTFPAAPGGADIFGVVLVVSSTVTPEGFTTTAPASSVSSVTTPTLTLTGANDLLVNAILAMGVTGTHTGSGLTERAYPKALPYGTLGVATAALSAAGSSPSYNIPLSDVSKPAVVTFGLKV